MTENVEKKMLKLYPCRISHIIYWSNRIDFSRQMSGNIMILNRKCKKALYLRYTPTKIRLHEDKWITCQRYSFNLHNEIPIPFLLKYRSHSDEVYVTGRY